MTTEGLRQFNSLLIKSRCQREEIDIALGLAKSELSVAKLEKHRWENSWLRRKFFAKNLEDIRARFEESVAKVDELSEQQRLSCIQIQIELPEQVERHFSRMRDDFALLAKSIRIWDTTGERKVNKASERSSMDAAVERKSVRFIMDKCDLFESEWSVPRLQNANGGDIFLYPLFAVYFLSKDNFALLEHREIKADFSVTKFMEYEDRPSDSIVLGTAWERCNKDGSPDRRFKDNREVPLLRYGQIDFRSVTGMNERYLFSNAERALDFARSYQALIQATA